MKYAFSPLAFALGSGALVVRQSQQCVRLQASGGATGTLGQLSDGQNRIGGSLPSSCYCLNNGGFTDSSGRGCILTSPTTQFQCDSGASSTTGFAISSTGSVTYNDNSQFYACPATDNGEYNVYTQPVSGQSKCVEITLSSGGSCGASASGSSSAAAPSQPASSKPVASPSPSQPASSQGTPPQQPSSKPAPSMPAPSQPMPPQQPSSYPVESQPAPSKPAPSQPAPSQPMPSSKPVQSQPLPSQPSQPAPPQQPSSKPMKSQPAPSKPAPSQPAPPQQPSSKPAPSKPAPSQPMPSSKPVESQPAPSQPMPSQPAPSPPAASSPAVSPSKPAASPSKPATSSPVAPSNSACPADINGNYQYPHLIVPVSSSSPSTPQGTSYFGAANSTTCSIFNFDIPQSYSGQTCSLIFLLPEQSQLQTSSYTLSGSGSLTFGKSATPATQSTTWENKPAGSSVGSLSVSPGNSYTVVSGMCAAGTTVTYQMCATGSLALRYFHDYNPSPLGLYIRQC